uniref:DEUBAD domain-containing protein n=1 Tax=Davidia involucrata TaxID=16924 RepID=A0A5B6ZEH7_DAVIN
MVADQRKKRLNAASIASSREQCGAKRKKLELPQYGLNMSSNISLEWNDKKKSVIAKKEQIVLKRRDLIPFVDYVPHCNNILADVFAVPREIFELENLTEVLSYEVWQTHLSEYERNLLTQFLPKGADADQVVQELLARDNFFFGNPFLKWGASLCFGNLHPDAVLHQEQCFKANKKAYYSELQKYHNDMIGNLQMWKERWASCKVPEKEIVQKIWRLILPGCLLYVLGLVGAGFFACNMGKLSSYPNGNGVSFQSLVFPIL